MSSIKTAVYLSDSSSSSLVLLNILCSAFNSSSRKPILGGFFTSALCINNLQFDKNKIFNIFKCPRKKQTDKLPSQETDRPTALARNRQTNCTHKNCPHKKQTVLTRNKHTNCPHKKQTDKLPSQETDKLPSQETDTQTALTRNKQTDRQTALTRNRQTNCPHKKQTDKLSSQETNIQTVLT